MTKQDILATPYGAAAGRLHAGILQREHVPAWNSFMVFYRWLKGTGFEPGMVATRGNPELPYGPDNCILIPYGKFNGVDIGPSIARYNQTVANLRRLLAAATEEDIARLLTAMGKE